MKVIEKTANLTDERELPEQSLEPEEVVISASPSKSRVIEVPR